MKRILALLSFLLVMVLPMVAQEALYIYHDGQLLEGIPMPKVDSIKYSHYDMDSVCHRSWQTQEIYCRDTVYRIPLTDIDSISFRMPDVIYQEGLFVLDQGETNLFDYVTSVDYDNFRFVCSPDVPSALLPNQGEVVWLDSIRSPFDSGWAGRVTDIARTDTGMVLMFEHVRPNDIFKQLIVAGTMMCSSEDSISDANQAPRRANGDGDDNFKMPDKENGVPATKIINLDSFTIDFADYINFANGKKDFENLVLQLVCKPSVSLDFCINIGLTDSHIKFYCEPKLDCTLSAGLKAQAGGNLANRDGSQDNTIWTKDFGKQIPLPHKFFGHIALKGFFRLEAKGAAELQLNFVLGGRSGCEYNGPDDEHADTGESENKKDGAGEFFNFKNITLDLNGSLSLWTGLGVDLGVGWGSTEIAEAGLALRVGPKFEASIETDLATLALDGADGVSTLYNLFGKTKLSASLHGDASLFYQIPVLNLVDTRLGERRSTPLGASFDFFKMDFPFLPQFKEPSITKIGTSATTISNRLSNAFYLLPCHIGLSIKSSSGYNRSEFYSVFEDESYVTANKSYTIPNSYLNSGYDDLRVFPSFTIAGYEFAASPFIDTRITPDIRMTDVKVDDNKVTISGKVVGYTNDAANKAEQHLLYVEASAYESVKFDYNQWSAGQQTVRVESAPTWTSFKLTESLMPGTAYKGVLMLYLKDNNKTYYSVPFDFTTSGSSSSTEEWVDLGLPSGLKWRSMNLGASKPTGKGNYYAWGETKSKSEYSSDTYDYEHKPKDNLSGNNDAAMAAGIGRMPTASEFIELKNNCKMTYTEIEGVKGFTFERSVNGTVRSIFIPAAGYYDHDVSSKVQESGKGAFLWTSSTVDDEYGYNCSIYDDYFTTEASSAHAGMSIRPVKK